MFGSGAPLSTKLSGSVAYYPGVVVTLTCHPGYNLSDNVHNSSCSRDGVWTPSLPQCINGNVSTAPCMLIDPFSPFICDRKAFISTLSLRLILDVKVTDAAASSESSELVFIIVGVSVFIVLIVSMLIVLAVKARWRLVCRKRRANPSHPDDANYPHGYTQVRLSSYFCVCYYVSCDRNSL